LPPLADAITGLRSAITPCWDVLLKISERIGRDWEPVDKCVSGIADYCASSIDDPAAIESLDPHLVAQYFVLTEIRPQVRIRQNE
jgi:hypothetical protein